MTKNKELEEREDRVERALKEYVLKESRLAEILRSVGKMAQSVGIYQ